jgi:hypothetical protein
MSPQLKIRPLLLAGIVCFLSFATSMRADAILGQVTFSGSFVHVASYDYNHPGSMPFGYFQGNAAVQQATGFFAPYVSSGDLLSMNTPYVWESPITGNWLPPTNPVVWSFAGFTLDARRVLVAGPQPGQVLGFVNMSGHNFDQTDLIYGPNGATAYWTISTGLGSPDVSITLDLRDTFASASAPDSGSTFLFVGLALAGLVLFRRGERKQVFAHSRD